MPKLVIKLDADNAWPDLKERGFESSEDLEVALLPGGMASGKPSVVMRINLPDGRVVIAQTSLDLWRTATRAFDGRLEYLADAAKGRS